MSNAHNDPNASAASGGVHTTDTGGFNVSPPAGPPPGAYAPPPGAPPGAGQPAYPPPAGAPGAYYYYPPPGAPPQGYYPGYPPPPGAPPGAEGAPGVPAGYPQYYPPPGAPPGTGYPAPGAYAPPPGAPTGTGYPAAGAYPPPPGAPNTYQPGYPPPAAGHQLAHVPTTMPHTSSAPPGQTIYLNVPIPDPFDSVRGASVPGWDATPSFEAFRKATKGFGTDESALISAMAPLNPAQMKALSVTYAQQSGKDFLQTIDKESSSWFNAGLRALALGPLGYDCDLLKKALSGVGTNEAILNEVLLGRSQTDLSLLMKGYRYLHGQDLKDAVQKDLSGKHERLFTIALTATPPPDNAPIDHATVQADVDALYKAGQGRSGTDEVAFCQILANRSKPHLMAVCDAYAQKYKSLTKIIKSEFSGDMRNSLLHIVKGLKSKRAAYGDGVWRDAKLLEESMKGMGTNDQMLVLRIVRAQWDKSRLTQIKAAYKQRYNKTLESRVIGETGGPYKKLMVALIQSDEAKPAKKK